MRGIKSLEKILTHLLVGLDRDRPHAVRGHPVPLREVPHLLGNVVAFADFALFGVLLLHLA